MNYPDKVIVLLAALATTAVAFAARVQDATPSPLTSVNDE